jgi:hypothetical protein
MQRDVHLGAGGQLRKQWPHDESRQPRWQRSTDDEGDLIGARALLEFEESTAIIEVIADRDDWGATGDHLIGERGMTAAWGEHHDISLCESTKPVRCSGVNKFDRSIGEEPRDPPADHTGSDDPDVSHQESGSTGRHPPRVGGVPSRVPTLMLAAVSTASASAEKMRMITFMAGGDDGTRTHDPLLAKQAL